MSSMNLNKMAADMRAKYSVYGNAHLEILLPCSAGNGNVETGNLREKKHEASPSVPYPSVVLPAREWRQIRSIHIIKLDLSPLIS